MTSVEEVLTEIIRGDRDDALDRIESVIKRRRHFLSEQLSYALNPGDTVMFVPSISPKYLRGRTAKVARMENRGAERVAIVDLDYRVGRFHKGIICKASLITKVDENA